MARGKFKSIARKCRCCGALNEERTRGIKIGLCYGCRKSRHESKKETVSRVHKNRLTIVLGLISFIFLSFAGYAIWFEYLVLPYGNRFHSELLEFKGLDVAVPALSLILLSVGTICGAVVNHYRSSCKQLFRDVMKVSLWAGFILYFVSIFFGKELRYRLFD
ncbi:MULTISPECIES: hypothetical protein [unclassified Pseudomonas]|jgi:hypothetical protein|uniref:hypothetical protein n=1 Tax=unclassified Pseudomonas TaxID=196821 RepID=UPI0010327C5B|nr:MULTISPECIES: hypothetical protein [unclassified Pseudomonas]